MCERETEMLRSARIRKVEDVYGQAVLMTTVPTYLLKDTLGIFNVVLRTQTIITCVLNYIFSKLLNYLFGKMIVVEENKFQDPVWDHDKDC